MRCYAVVSGPDRCLSVDEIKAVLETYGLPKEAEVMGGVVLFDAGQYYHEITSRLAFVSEAGRVLGVGNDEEGLNTYAISKEFSRTSFKVDSEGFQSGQKKQLDARLGEVILKEASGSSVNLDTPEKVLRVIKTGGEVVYGILDTRFRGRWKERRPRARPFFHPVAMFPKLSRLMVNLSRVRKGDLFFDPCAGTGSLLLEASEMGMEVVGMDVSKKMVFGFRRNLRAYAVESYHSILGDARHIPLRWVDGIATDVPYGRASPHVEARPLLLARAMLEQAVSVLKPGGYIVMMTSDRDYPGEVASVAMVSHYDLYVHRSLTRRLTVYRNR